MKNQIKLSDHFSYKKIIQFTLPSVLMYIWISIYGVVDGFFIANFVGETEFAAQSMIFPFVMILNCIGNMFGTGGAALVGAELGAKEEEKANRHFSLIIYTLIVVSLILTFLGILFVRPVAKLIGATENMLPHCVTYGVILILFNAAFALQAAFQSFFITAEKPKLGMASSILSGFVNIGLDALFVMIFKWGLVGAAIATGMSQLAGAVFPMIYFSVKNNSLLRFSKTKFEKRPLIQTITNGSSEFMTSISFSFICMIYNFQLIRMIGEMGVTAYNVVMYINFIFVSSFIGYTIGVAPLVSFNYGAENRSELKNILNKSKNLIFILSIMLIILSNLFARQLSSIFVSHNEELLNMTAMILRIYSIQFIICGFNIFSSGFFTALNNGLVSAILSFTRILVFQFLSILILPIFFGLNGVWCSIIVAESLSFALTIYCILKYKNTYGY